MTRSNLRALLRRVAIGWALALAIEGLVLAGAMLAGFASSGAFDLPWLMFGWGLRLAAAISSASCIFALLALVVWFFTAKEEGSRHGRQR